MTTQTRQILWPQSYLKPTLPAVPKPQTDSRAAAIVASSIGREPELGHRGVEEVGGDVLKHQDVGFRLSALGPLGVSDGPSLSRVFGVRSELVECRL